MRRALYADSTNQTVDIVEVNREFVANTSLALASIISNVCLPPHVGDIDCRPLKGIPVSPPNRRVGIMCPPYDAGCVATTQELIRADLNYLRLLHVRTCRCCVSHY